MPTAGVYFRYLGHSRSIAPAILPTPMSMQTIATGLNRRISSRYVGLYGPNLYRIERRGSLRPGYNVFLSLLLRASTFYKCSGASMEDRSRIDEMILDHVTDAI